MAGLSRKVRRREGVNMDANKCSELKDYNCCEK
jgi:hypothetical protein